MNIVLLGQHQEGLIGLQFIHDDGFLIVLGVQVL
jgi:hypothetical protein